MPEIQNWSDFFLSFICTWFDRAWKADHEYILFISIRPFFGWKNRKKLEWLRKCYFYIEFFFSIEIVEFQFQLFCELFESTIFGISMKNWVQKCYLIRCRANKAKKILSNTNRSNRLKVCVSEHSCKPIYFFVTIDRSNCVILLEPLDHGLQKYLFGFFYCWKNWTFFSSASNMRQMTEKCVRIYRILLSWSGQNSKQIAYSESASKTASNQTRFSTNSFPRKIDLWSPSGLVFETFPPSPLGVDFFQKKKIL